ncbi:hypothetical protein HUG10_21385 (plasmid) [Halorarum halophilum]|uniref:Uncharacterized protein n=1 Tax=Halorarum halophilum TaxID=2743090 RepID=A0A7D5L341_9EURY|nr:hypothetical protein [Halobaculum halophilum]QLG30143.1 hypothetical protein HUG10_21385 [Halobaculum halophilum]
MSAFVYVGLILFWVSLLIVGVVLYRHMNQRAENRHEQTMKKLENQEKLFEHEDEL